MTRLPRKQMRALLNKRTSGAPSEPSNHAWVALVVSAITFLITLVGFVFSVIAFWTSVDRIDDLRVVIGRAPSVSLSPADKVQIVDIPQLTFINSGNRTASVTDMRAAAWIYKGETPGTDDCKSRRNSYPYMILFNAKAFALKAGEAEVVEATFKEDEDIAKVGDKTYELRGVKYFENEKILVCLELSMATPDKFVEGLRTPVFLIVFENSVGTLKPLYTEYKPISVLYSERFDDLRSWFSEAFGGWKKKTNLD
jgi:hypothetical protein